MPLVAAGTGHLPQRGLNALAARGPDEHLQRACLDVGSVQPVVEGDAGVEGGRLGGEGWGEEAGDVARRAAVTRVRVQPC